MMGLHLFKRQWRTYTCAPTTLRICLHAFNAEVITEKEAMRLCHTTRKGTNWEDLQAAFRKKGMKVIDIKKHNTRNWDNFLKLGYYIVSADDLTHASPHVVVVYKRNKNSYKVVDPVLGFPMSVTKEYMISTAQGCAFAVCSA